MSSPHFAPFPSAAVRQNILPEDWQLYLDSCVSLVDVYLRFEDEKFSLAISGDDSVSKFLISFFHDLANDGSLTPQTSSLRKKCFFLVYRILSRDDVDDALLSWAVLSDVSHAFPKSEQLRLLLQSIWKRKSGIIERSLQTAKNSLIKNLESKRPEEAESTLNKIAPLLRVSRDASIYMLIGSDFLDALYAAYPLVAPSMQRKLVTIAYLGLISILEDQKPNYSLLSDHLYGLKSNEEQQQKKEPGKKTLVTDLVTNTPLLEKINDKPSAPEAARVKNTAASLVTFRQPGYAKPKQLIRRKINKGKEKATVDGSGHGAITSEVHVHRMSLVTQIQDLFPDLGAGFIVKLLDEYNDDIEQVTAHLLEESLPPHLASADRSEQL